MPTFTRGAQASRPNSPKCIFCLELFLVSSLFEDILLYKLSFQQHLIGLTVCNHRSLRVFWDIKKVEGEGENSINFCIIGKWYKLNLIVLVFFFAFLFFVFFWLSFYNLISASSPFSNDGWNMLLLQQPSTDAELTKKLLNKQDIYKAGNTT